MPNRGIRIGERSDAARSSVAALRAQFDERPLVLTTPGSVNWITGGLSDPIDITSPSDPAWAVDAKNGRALITTEIEVPRLLGDFDTDALGWDVIAVPWFDGDAPLRAADGVLRREGRPTPRRERRLRNERHDRDRSRAHGVERPRARGLARSGRRRGGRTRGRTRRLGARRFDGLRHRLDRQPRAGTSRRQGRVPHRRRRRSTAPRASPPRDRGRHPQSAHGGRRRATGRPARRRDPHRASRATPTRSWNSPNASNPVHRAVLNRHCPATAGATPSRHSPAATRRSGRPARGASTSKAVRSPSSSASSNSRPPQTQSPFWHVACQANTAVAWNPSLGGGAKIEETYLVGNNGLELITDSGEWAMTTDEGRSTVG